MIGATASVRDAAVRRNLPAVRRVVNVEIPPWSCVTCGSLPSRDLLFIFCRWKGSPVMTTLSMSPAQENQ
jgi:hypothetical protein